MFVLVVASVNLVSANPICTECGNSTADSASKTVSVEKSLVLHVLIYSQMSSKRPVTLFNCGCLIISLSEW